MWQDGQSSIELSFIQSKIKKKSIFMNLLW